MTNRLTMAEIGSIESPYRSGHSNREISRLLSVDRGTVNKFVRILKRQESPSNSTLPSETSSSVVTAEECQNRPNPQTGSEGVEPGFSGPAEAKWPVLEPNPQTGSVIAGDAEKAKTAEEDLRRLEAGNACTADHRTDELRRLVPSESIAMAAPGESESHRTRSSSRNGPTSLCGPYAEVISHKFEQGLSVQRIHQDLQREHGFAGSYHSVRRYLLHCGVQVPLPFRRMEVGPGEEAQIDFGTAAPVVLPNGKKRRPWMFRIVLSCSRKAYSEVVWQQTTDNFIAAIENAFQYFGEATTRGHGTFGRCYVDSHRGHTLLHVCQLIRRSHGNHRTPRGSSSFG